MWISPPRPGGTEVADLRPLLVFARLASFKKLSASRVACVHARVFSASSINSRASDTSNKTWRSSILKKKKKKKLQNREPLLTANSFLPFFSPLSPALLKSNIRKVGAGLVKD